MDVRNDLQIGDVALVKVDDTGSIIFDVNFYDDRYTRYPQEGFEVIGRNDHHYVLLVNPKVEGTVEVTQRLIELYLIDPHHLHVDVFILRKQSIGGRRQPDYFTNPLSCLLCSNTVPYALPNLPDRRSFVCWSCKNDKRNEFKLAALDKKHE